MIVADRLLRRGPDRASSAAPAPAGSSSRRPRAPGSSPSARASAHDYDPLGDDEEHSDEASRVVDRDDGTAWTTESYQDGLEGAGKTGVGLYIDAKPKVAAVALSDRDPRARLAATIYAAPPGPAPKSVPEGWTKVGGGTVNAKDKSFKLDTGGTEYRYYLVWITKLADGRPQRRDLRDPAVPGSRGARRRRRARPRSARARSRSAGRRAPGTPARTPPRASGRRSSP